LTVLIAEDDPISRQLLAAALIRSGREVVVTSDGVEALATLEGENAPSLAILDWMMPGLDGIEVCRKIRQTNRTPSTYIILLTARTHGGDIVSGLSAGADDYVTKPFEREELLARVQVGERVIELQNSLAQRVRELEIALSRVKLLQGMLPICSYCKKIRDDQNYWQRVETYISTHSEAQFSHSICPDCYDRLVAPEVERLKQETRKKDT
jgi:sigma-B regulation protein RsbU (phosphoserine phosphatase)